MTLPPLDGTDLAALLASNQQVLAAGLAATDVPTNLRPSLATATGDRAQVYGDDCVAIGVVEEPNPCRYGDPAAPTKVVLFGDSHAAQWTPPLIEMAEAGQFELVVLVKGGCPTAAVSIPTNTLARTCPIWRDRALEIIAAEQPDLTVVSAWSGYPNSDADWSAGFTETMSRLAPLSDRSRGARRQPAVVDGPGGLPVQPPPLGQRVRGGPGGRRRHRPDRRRAARGRRTSAARSSTRRAGCARRPAAR